MSALNSDSTNWTVKITPPAEKQLKRLPKPVALRLRNQLHQIAEKENPLDFLTPLKGDWVPFYKMWVGDYRLIIDVEDETLTLILIRAGHRKNVYS
ncbi:MAG: type II toxin-antitoxin system RelE/ParE family toxin [Actinobacteria bacterium]|nr:type II toxin-antitoxin system RelE/ParE family toxin [Actinomycetota bacterium]